MPIFSVHEIAASMRAAASAQDYRQKERQEWSV